MTHLAELNQNKICIGTKTVKNFIDDGNHVEISEPNFDHYVWRKYENGEWSEEKYEPETTAPITEFEQLKEELALTQQALNDLILGGGL